MDIFTNIFEVESARVPIIKFSLYEVQFDVLFAALDDLKHLKRLIKGKQIGNEEWRRLSEASQNSLYGRIACDNLKTIAGSFTFKLVLKAVRFWAMRRGLYKGTSR